MQKDHCEDVLVQNSFHNVGNLLVSGKLHAAGVMDGQGFSRLYFGTQFTIFDYQDGNDFGCGRWCIRQPHGVGEDRVAYDIRSNRWSTL